MATLTTSSSANNSAENMSGINQLLQAAQVDMTPGIEMLAAAAQNATPAGFPCPHCNKTYPMASGLRRHIKRAHGGTSGSSNGNPFVSGQSLEKRPSKCTFCQAELPSPATQTVRRQHMRGECANNPYSCTSCSKVFVSPGGLQRHSLLHNGKRPFQCTICNKEFTQASHLKVHMNGHTGEKPYHCDFEDCNKTYSDPSSLRSHKLAHAGIKSKKKRNPDAPYLANPKCAYCDQRFVSRASRDQHARECASNPYRCMICQKACLGMVKLERHIRSHSRSRVSSLKAQEIVKNKKSQSPDPKCAYCSERFPTRVVRDRHSRMCATNPYRCNLCFKAFLGSAKLLRHARSHGENGSYSAAAVASAIEHAKSLAAAGHDALVARTTQLSQGVVTGVNVAESGVVPGSSPAVPGMCSTPSALSNGACSATTVVNPLSHLPVPVSSGLSNSVVSSGTHSLISLQPPPHAGLSLTQSNCSSPMHSMPSSPTSPLQRQPQQQLLDQSSPMQQHPPQLRLDEQQQCDGPTLQQLQVESASVSRPSQLDDVLNVASHSFVSSVAPLLLGHVTCGESTPGSTISEGLSQQQPVLSASVSPSGADDLERLANFKQRDLSPVSVHSPTAHAELSPAVQPSCFPNSFQEALGSSFTLPSAVSVAPMVSSAGPVSPLESVPSLLQTILSTTESSVASPQLQLQQGVSFQEIQEALQIHPSAAASLMQQPLLNANLSSSEVPKATDTFEAPNSGFVSAVPCMEPVVSHSPSCDIAPRIKQDPLSSSVLLPNTLDCTTPMK